MAGVNLSNYHFLDSCILIGSRISWDSQANDVTRYMKIDKIKRSTSKSVYNEVKGVIQRNRREINKYLNLLWGEFSNPSYDFVNEDTIYRFSKKYFKNLENPKIKSALDLFMNRNMFDICQNLIGDKNSYSTYILEIGDTFKLALDSLDIDCTSNDGAFIERIDFCPLCYDSLYSDEYIKLMQVINYEEDVRILLDSYYISKNHFQQPMHFVTTDDEHILDKKESIEGVLTNLQLFHPNNY